MEPFTVSRVPDRTLLVDTAGWMAMADAADPMHAASRGSRDAWLRSGGVWSPPTM